MIIYDGFYISGFTRMDKGEAGAVFVRYEDEKAEEGKRAPEIREAARQYGGANTENYTVCVPKPRARKLAACAIVTRTSKNNYTATVFGARRIETFKEHSLDGLRRKVAEFFREEIA
ncbi:MAG: hypothetical protein K2N74_05760 [Clostridiales bacterium]|nr:hypothetical protein [Clostridiales bacterium]